MNDAEFDAIVNKIQEEVFAEARNALGVKGFDRWRNPRFCGKMTDSDGFARVKGSCGDTMEMYIKVEGERLREVSYTTDGCGSSSVAGSFTAELATGRSIEEVFDLSGADVLKEIGSFPEAEEHCAYLAVKTLQEALNAYMVAQTKKGKLKELNHINIDHCS
ncbi:hypothetical protein DGMP_02440 [Desulfomarina profundi]|uniref:NIF system FeS cluster assembly NifU N-terminal domain-containing protein n=1 Tax=Desulfomarina profundi TaxID=2772557 RepID=A0A8D5FF58_9BACT|nr:iron-sulfur cluster assembly scaffold protein [Desulfomarina profundi]BCL59551.1 hypothetical protein DGMP_02440 [Desulfomarina profundi]